MDLLGPVLEDLDEILNKCFGTRVGYEVVSVQDHKSLTLYQALGNAHRYVRICHDNLQHQIERSDGQQRAV